MIAAVESYLAVRRAAGFTLSNTEYLLGSFADFALEQKQPHVRTATVIDWASQGEIGRATTHALPDHLPLCSAPSRRRPAPRSPAANYFGYRLTRRVPHIYSRDEIAHLVLAATKLSPSDRCSLRHMHP